MQIIYADKPDGVPARCLECGRVFRQLCNEGACPYCSSPEVAPLIFLSTSTAIAGFLSVLAWELEAFVAGVHFLAAKKVSTAGHVVLLAASIALTVFACLKGKREIAKVRALGGRCAITSFQAIMIVLILLVFSALIMAFIEWQIG